MASRRPAGSLTVRHISWRPMCPGSSWPATSGTTPCGASHRRPARVPWRFTSSIAISLRYDGVTMEGLTTNEEFLRRLPLFEGLPAEDLDRIYRMASEVTVEDGELLIAEGERSDSVFIVIDGRLEVTRRSGAQDLVLAQRGPGDVIGEMAVIRRSASRETVRALERSHLMRIDQSV